MGQCWIRSKCCRWVYCFHGFCRPLSGRAVPTDWIDCGRGFKACLLVFLILTITISRIELYIISVGTILQRCFRSNKTIQNTPWTLHSHLLFRGLVSWSSKNWLRPVSITFLPFISEGSCQCDRCREACCTYEKNNQAFNGWNIGCNPGRVSVFHFSGKLALLYRFLCMALKYVCQTFFDKHRVYPIHLWVPTSSLYACYESWWLRGGGSQDIGGFNSLRSPFRLVNPKLFRVLLTKEFSFEPNHFNQMVMQPGFVKQCTKWPWLNIPLKFHSLCADWKYAATPPFLKLPPVSWTNRNNW